MMSDVLSKHTGVPITTYTLMHANEVVAIAQRDVGTVEVKIKNKLPFGLRMNSPNFEDFIDWLRKRVDNLQRSYMNKIYMARKIGRDFNNILRDSCALSITDQFWIKRSDIDITWEAIQKLRDCNDTLAMVALSGNTANLDWEAVQQGTTSLFTTKGHFPKAILGNHMQKLGGTQEREWVAFMIGKALGLPVQDVAIKNPSISQCRNDDGSQMTDQYVTGRNIIRDSTGHPVHIMRPQADDTLVEITLFTSEDVSLVHASELFVDTGFGEAHREGQHHRYFYDWLPNDTFKREFERVLILNWLISNHDMHGENFGCLYSPKNFEIIGVAPSFDHNSADFDGTIPELDVPDIVIPCIKYHRDVISKIEAGHLDEALQKVKYWLTPEQKKSVMTVGAELVNLYRRHKF